MNYTDFFAAPNGFPLESDATLGFMQTDYQSAILGLAKLAGSDLVIVSGMVDDGVTVTDGWFLWNGAFTRFQGGTKQTNIILQETIVAKQNDNGSMVDRYYTRVAKFGSGPGQVAYSSLKRIQTVEKIYQTLLQLFSLEPAVIMQGLDVSNVLSGPGTLEISTGVVIIDEAVKEVSAYAGTYPVYLDSDGQWQNSVPTGTYIKFDPYTSQRLGSVYKRATTQPGEVIMQVVSSDRFDGTGLGRWDLLGFAIMNGANGTEDMRGRFPVAYDERLSDPANGIWDPLYNTPGNDGGEKDHVLTIDEMPEHRHGPDTIDPGESGLIRRSISGENKTTDTTDLSAPPEEPDIVTPPQPVALAGGDEGHENRPPFKVFVFAQRI